MLRVMAGSGSAVMQSIVGTVGVARGRAFSLLQRELENAKHPLHKMAIVIHGICGQKAIQEFEEAHKTSRGEYLASQLYKTLSQGDFNKGRLVLREFVEKEIKVWVAGGPKSGDIEVLSTHLSLADGGEEVEFIKRVVGDSLSSQKIMNLYLADPLMKLTPMFRRLLMRDIEAVKKLVKEGWNGAVESEALQYHDKAPHRFDWVFGPRVNGVSYAVFMGIMRSAYDHSDSAAEAFRKEISAMV